MTTVKNIYDYINFIAPFSAQEEWDNAGFLIGDFRKVVNKAVLCLDVTKAVADFAAEKGADLIISHHPIIFKGVTEMKKGSAVYTCIQNDIAVISAHTNFDKSKYGINYNLAQKLELKNVKQIENSFLTVGELEAEMNVSDFAKYVSEKLNVSGIRFTGSEKPVKTVALGGGACEEYIDVAVNSADCFLTGDMKYHFMLDCAEQGYPVISAGHYETEHDAFLMLLDKLKLMFREVKFFDPEQKNPVLSV